MGILKMFGLTTKKEVDVSGISDEEFEKELRKKGYEPISPSKRTKWGGLISSMSGVTVYQRQGAIDDDDVIVVEEKHSFGKSSRKITVPWSGTNNND